MGEELSVPVQPVERKLAAIFAADIAGYSRLMARDEVGTLARLKACRVTIDELIASHRGRIFNTAGDSIVADFASAVDAVQCAVAVQAAVAVNDVAAARQAIDRGLAVRQYERRPRAGIFCGRDGRGNHHSPVTNPLALCDRSELDLHLQRPSRRCEAGRAGTWRPPCA